jgi:hypothetical protein
VVVWRPANLGGGFLLPTNEVGLSRGGAGLAWSVAGCAYMGTSLMKQSAPVGPYYSRAMPRALWSSYE